MEKLLQYLMNNNGELFERFQAGEWTHVTGFVYHALLGTVKDGADRLIIKRNGFEWYGKGILLRSYLGGHMPEPNPISYGAWFRKILERDENIRQHFFILSETNGEVIVDIRPNS